MSKITQAKKEAKAKGKSPKASKTKTAAGPTPSAVSQARNYGRCLTCKFYGKPCKQTKEYTPRKAEKPCYIPGPKVQH